MLINVFRKETFCRVPYIPAKLMGHMLGSSPQYHSCCYSQHLSLAASGREPGLQFHGNTGTSLTFNETRLSLIRMSSSWKMTQVNAFLELCTSNRALGCLPLYKHCVGQGHNHCPLVI